VSAITAASLGGGHDATWIRAALIRRVSSLSDGQQRPSCRWHDAGPENDAKTNMERLRSAATWLVARWRTAGGDGAPAGGGAPASSPRPCATNVAARLNDVEARWLFGGPVDGGSFRVYVGILLGPTLKPRDVVIMDNLGRHEGKPASRSCSWHERPRAAARHLHPHRRN
jgi:hypothetical protein